MDPNELLELLDLSAKSTHPPDGAASDLATDTPEPDTTGAKSPTAFALDEWGLRRGRDLIAERERLRKSGTDAFAAADFFGAAFEPDPKLLSPCADLWRHQFLAQMLDTPEYHALHAATQLDDIAAAIAAGHFAEQFAKLNKEDTKDAAGGSASASAGSEGDLTREMAALRAVGKAVVEACKEVAELKEASAALGLGPGQPGSNDSRAIAEIYKRVRNDPGLRRISELAGRFRRVAHRAAVAQFGTDTRADTLQRAAEKIRITKFKLQTYAEYLTGEKERLDRAAADAEQELRAKVTEIAGEPAEPAV